MIAIVIYAIILLGIFGGLYALFPRADRKAYEALIPGYNLYVWLQIIKKPWWWLILLIFPGPNVIMLMIMAVNTGTVFGKRSWTDVTLNAFFPFITLPYLGFIESPQYIGPIDRKKFPKDSILEWRDAILFAIVAASIIRTYTFEAFTIPTSSMEKDMLIGDYLFVSKLNYGPKVPQTPLSFPFAHHSLPLTNNTIPSYLEWIGFDYHRIPGFSKPERNDVMVFNYPGGDTVDVQFQSNKGFEQMVRETAVDFMAMDYQRGLDLKDRSYYVNKSREFLLENRDFTIRPVDKREHFIKRCVGIAGDEIEIKDGVLFVNREQAEQPEDMQFNYLVEFKGQLPTNPRNLMMLKEKYGINFQDVIEIEGMRYFLFPLTFQAYDKMKRDPMVSRVQRMSNKPDRMNKLTEARLMNRFDANYVRELKEAKQFNPELTYFPNHPDYNWTEDFMGPLTIPKAGETIELSLKNLPIYRRVIGVYENNELAVKDGKIYINGNEANSYTFKMDYYWLMGDNRHNSADSRYWGFVPEDHVVGKASLIWMSLDPELGIADGKIRWDRFFSLVD